VANVTDGLSNTIILMEIGNDQKVPWSSPQDIEIETLESLEIDNGHVGVVCAAMADGSVHSIGKTVAIERFIRGCKKSDGGGMGDF
jgi:hypothetical protein